MRIIHICIMYNLKYLFKKYCFSCNTPVHGTLQVNFVSVLVCLYCTCVQSDFYFSSFFICIE